MKIYVIRHGETDSNVLGLLQGQSDRPLNENGRRLAVLSGRGMRGIRFDRCYTSPLKRAKETAEIVLRESGNERTPLLIDERLKEIHMGEWEGKHFRTEEDGIDVAAMKQFFRNAFEFSGFPGGESVSSLCERTQAFLAETAALDQNMTVLVSTHGTALRAMLNRLYEDPSDFWHGHVPYNCAVSLVETEDGTMVLKEDDRIFYDQSLIVDRYARNDSK